MHGVNLDAAAFRDGHRALERFGNFAEHTSHFFRRLEKELVGGEFHSMRVAHRLAGLNAEQDFLRPGIRVSQIMAIVGRNQGNAGLFR